MEGEESWVCQPCGVDNKVDKKRCFLCMRWKDGCFGTPLKRRATKKAKRVVKTATISKIKRAKVNAIAKSIMGPSWRCVPCKAENEIHKKRCGGCMRWKGGKRENYRKKDTPTKPKKSKGKSRTKVSTNTVMIPSKCTVKITKGSSPGTVKMWECKKCNQFNHWNRYSCELCGRRAGGPVWDVTLQPEAGASPAAVLPPSSSPANQTRKGGQPVSSEEWVCRRCNESNHGSSLCTKCFASRNRR